MILLDGKTLAKKIKNKLKEEILKMKKKPVLAIILVGNDLASKIYVANKKRACEEVGIKVKNIKLPAKATQNKLIKIIEKLNQDKHTTAIIVQLPLPKHLSARKIIEHIKPRKDADCLHPLNFGKSMQGDNDMETFTPATPLGIITLLDEYKIPIAGKNAVVVGRSNIAGKPMAQMLLNRNATVTICHSRTKNLKKYTQQADILVAAAGKKGLITKGMIKKGSVIIDVGVNRAGKKIFGDVDFKSVSKKAAFITPVPGGVGPLTIAMLLQNTVRLATAYR